MQVDAAHSGCTVKLSDADLERLGIDHSIWDMGVFGYFVENRVGKLLNAFTVSTGSGIIEHHCELAVTRLDVLQLLDAVE